MKNKAERIARFYSQMSALGFTEQEATALRRCEMTLHRWAERQCNGEVERDEVTGKVYAYHPHTVTGRIVVPDRETGALKRATAIVEARNSRAWIMSGETGEYHPKRGNTATDVMFYHQTDPRGCAAYLVRKSELAGADIHSVYNRGFAVCY